MLKSSKEWEMALDNAGAAFKTWQRGDREGFFFLDALDEARLASHSDLRGLLH